MRNLILASSLACVLVSLAAPHARASQLDDIQEELETQSFENDMRHDEEMDALNARHRVRTYAPAPTYAPRVQPPSNAALEQLYNTLTAQCQGGRWNARTQRICKQRDALGARLGTY